MLLGAMVQSRFISLIAICCSAWPVAAFQSETRTSEECVALLTKAEEAGITRGVDKKDMSLIVSEEVWNIIPYNQKLNIARTFSCALSDPGKMLPEFDIKSDMTNHVLARWYLGNLDVE